MAKIESYENVKEEAAKPDKMRRSLIMSNRGNTRKPRRYHMDEKRAQKLRATFKKTGVFQNPYRKGGLYFAFVQSLANLGLNEAHAFKVVKKQMKDIMSVQVNKKNQNLWDVFSKRKPRNALSGRDINGRIIENAMILQRLTGFHPFGEKLRQVHSCVDILKDSAGLPKFMLNTNFSQYNKVEPTNEIRRSKKPPDKEKEKE